MPPEHPDILFRIEEKVDCLTKKFSNVDKIVAVHEKSIKSCEEEKKRLFKKTNGLDNKVSNIDKEFGIFKEVHSAVNATKVTAAKVVASGLSETATADKAKINKGMYVIAIVMIVLNIITLTLLGIRTFREMPEARYVSEQQKK